MAADFSMMATALKEPTPRQHIIDWQVRETVRAKLRILVRRTLQKYKYPPDKSDEAIELILKQAEVLSNSWTT